VKSTHRRLVIGGLVVVAATTASVLVAPSGTAESGRTGPTSAVIATSTAPATTYRIPDIAVTTKGTILLAYDRRNGSSGDLPNDIDTLLVRSTDGGRTWSTPSDIVDYPAPQGCGDSSMIVDRRSGRIFLLCTYSAGNVGFGSSQPGSNDTTDPYTLHVQVRHSDDDGRTWNAPTDLNPQVKDPAWRGYFAASGHGIQTSTGRLIQPVVVLDAEHVIHSADIYSDDHGSTWHAGALLSGNTDESKAVELADGTVVQNSRPDVGGYRFISTSHDAAQTFSPAVADPQLPDPKVNGDEIRVNPDRHGARTAWLLEANDADQLGRDHLTLRLSCNDGATWPVQTLITAGPSGYVAMAMIAKNRVGLFYEGGTQSYTEKMIFETRRIDDLDAHCG
jgi:sialidase-1